ncbi:MAG: hypothetical protein ACXQS5_06705 [Candidatus Methanospirareceae archaeon]
MSLRMFLATYYLSRAVGELERKFKELVAVVEEFINGDINKKQLEIELRRIKTDYDITILHYLARIEELADTVVVKKKEVEEE